METFGISGGMRRGGRGRGRGRGRGGSRGGRGGSRPQGRGGSSGWRSGRGTRGNRSKTWVDYPIHADGGLPTNVQNGPSTVRDNQESYLFGIKYYLVPLLRYLAPHESSFIHGINFSGLFWSYIIKGWGLHVEHYFELVSQTTCDNWTNERLFVKHS